MGYIDVNGISLSLPDGRPLLDEVSFRVGEGTTSALIGANGAGKTTLMRMINRLVEPTSGDIRIDGAPNGANPELSALIDEAISPKWQLQPQHLLDLMKQSEDKAFLQEMAAIKYRRKTDLAKFIKTQYKLTVDPNSIFDIQIKRIHSYKRQFMNILHILHLYNKLKAEPKLEMLPRTFIFGGKAAPGYHIAKETIRLINTVAALVNGDRSVRNRMKVVYIENYGVSLAEMLFPAADVSEQISTAGKEASGTSNMKFMMNGAITLGTLDGANVEIHEAVGDDNCVIFGLKAEEVLEYYANGSYSAWNEYNANEAVHTVMDQLINGFFAADGSANFNDLYNNIFNSNDEFFVLKDFPAYEQAQLAIETRYRDQPAWLRSSLINIANSGRFSSDRTIAEYAQDIWRVSPIKMP